MNIFELVGSIFIDTSQSTNALNQAQQQAQALGDKFTNTGKLMGIAGAGIVTGVGAIGAAMFSVANDSNNASTLIQQSLGLSAEEADKLKENARNIYEQGFGESLEATTQSLIQVKQNMQDLNGVDLEKAITSGMMLADTFDADINEVTRAAGNLMTNFGISSEEAFDMMANGAQNGLNFSNEMFDNLAEYAPLWANLGYGAEEMFGALEAGAENGVYNLDYLNDVVKEFGIRIIDGSKSTSEAMSYLFRSDDFDSFMSNLEAGGTKSKEFMEVVALAGKENAEQLVKDIQKGGKTAEKAYDYLEHQMGRAGEITDGLRDGSISSGDAMREIAQALKEIEDPITQAQMGVAMFGTKWEDLGGEVVISMLTAGQSIEGFAGSMDAVNEAQEKTFGQRWDALVRTAGGALEPFGKILMTMAEDILPVVGAWIQKISDFFENLPAPVQKSIVVIGLIAGAFGLLLLGLAPLMMMIGGLIPLFSAGGVAAGVFSAGLLPILGTVALVVAAILALAGLVYIVIKNWDVITEFFSNLWEGIKNIFSGFADWVANAFFSYTPLGFIIDNWGVIAPYLSELWDGIKNKISEVLTAIGDFISQSLEFWSSIFSAGIGIISTIWSGLWDGIVSVVEIAKEVISGIIEKLLGSVTGIIGKIAGALKDAKTKMMELLGLDKKEEEEKDKKGSKKSSSSNYPEPVRADLPRYARGTDFASGGLSLVGEEGAELVNLPRGSKVFNASETKELLSGNVTQHITINSPKALSPSETARKYKQASRELAMEWGV